MSECYKVGIRIRKMAKRDFTPSLTLPRQRGREKKSLPPRWGKVRMGVKKGFTLIEVLAALVIFAIALAGLSYLLTTTMQANALARRMTAATNLAQDKLEEIRNTAYTSVASGSDSSPLTETGGTGGTGAIYTRSWTVAAGPAANTQQVTVAVQWTDQTGSHTVQLQTIIANLS